MSETQLREAFGLMKQGDKQGATKLIQAVLKEDRSNLQAWWLFSHVLDDEEKVVKSLEKVLALNPEHIGARKKLASMRPEYAHLAPSPAPISKAKNVKKSPKQNGAIAWIFGIAAFMVSASISYGLVGSLMGGGVNLANVEGPPPEEVAFLQLTAAFNGEIETMRQYTCDSLEDEWIELVEDMNEDISTFGVVASQVKFNFSNLSLELLEDNGSQRSYTMTGEMEMQYQDRFVSLDVTEIAGYEPRVNLVVNDNHWVVCSL